MTTDGARPTTRNVAPGPVAEAVVDELLAAPFGNWHVESATATIQLRVTKRGEAQVHRSVAASQAPPDDHDRAKAHLLDPGDGVLLFEPYYGYHLSAVRLAGLTPLPEDSELIVVATKRDENCWKEEAPEHRPEA